MQPWMPRSGRQSTTRNSPSETRMSPQLPAPERLFQLEAGLHPHEERTETTHSISLRGSPDAALRGHAGIGKRKGHTGTTQPVLGEGPGALRGLVLPIIRLDRLG